MSNEVNIRSRAWICTLNNPRDHAVEDYEQYLKKWVD
jgi:hypothetical protein